MMYAADKCNLEDATFKMRLSLCVFWDMNDFLLDEIKMLLYFLVIPFFIFISHNVTFFLTSVAL